MLVPDPARHQAQIDDMPNAYNSPNKVVVHLDWT